MSQIYLDHAATTAMHPAVLEAMLPYYSENYYNPSTAYQAGIIVAAMETVAVSLLVSHPFDLHTCRHAHCIHFPANH